jgi:hypothetical protein
MAEGKKAESMPQIQITCPTGGSVPPTFHVNGTADLGFDAGSVTCELHYAPPVDPPVRQTGIGINSGKWSCQFSNVPLPGKGQTTALGAVLLNDLMVPQNSYGPVNVTVDSSAQDPCA